MLNGLKCFKLSIKIRENMEFYWSYMAKNAPNYPPWFEKRHNFIYPKWLSALNYPRWLDTILNFTHTNWLKMLQIIHHGWRKGIILFILNCWKCFELSTIVGEIFEFYSFEIIKNSLDYSLGLEKVLNFNHPKRLKMI